MSVDGRDYGPVPRPPALTPEHSRYDVYMDLYWDDKLPAGHTYSYSEGDSEYDSYCECGKWLEAGEYEHWDHIHWILKDGTD